MNAPGFKDYVLAMIKDHISQFMLLLLGISMMCIGIQCGPEIIAGVPDTNFQARHYFAYLTLTLFGLLGIMSMVWYKGNVSAGIMTAGITVYMIFLTTVSFNGLEDESRTLLRLFFYFIEVFCLIFSFSLIIGMMHNSKRLSMVFFLYFCRYFFIILLDWHHGMPLSECYEAHYSYYAPMVMIFLCIVALNVGDAKYSGSMKRLKKNILALETTSTVDQDAYILRGDLYKLLRGPNTWQDSEIEVLEKELVITLYSYSQKLLLVFRKWKDSEDPILLINPNISSLQDLSPVSLPVMHVVCNDEPEKCDIVRLYGKKGMFIDISVRNRHIRKYRMMKEIAQKYSPFRFINRNIRKKDSDLILFPDSSEE